MSTRSLTIAFLAAVLGVPRAAAQDGPAPVRVETAGGVAALAVVAERGYAAVAASALERLGWQVDSVASGVLAIFGRDTLVLEPGSPFLAWQGQLYQLADAPYSADGRFYVPVQLLIDWLPAVLGGSFSFDPEAGVLRAGPLVAEAPERRSDEVMGKHARLVVIDPGHGGADPGALGRLGTREKDVALRFSLELARFLARDSTLEVRLTRERDVLVPLWERGELATRWRRNRPAVFVSIHANSLPRSRAIRGFETYFLSEARTDHERRVAAIENAPLQLEGESPSGGADESLAFILKELVKLDHPHWSALLAEMVQRQLARVHPGPNRGVKQAPLAVITNALMPAVLVEIGFVSNRAEEALLRDRQFQREAAEAVAEAVRAFFRRYPPGAGMRAEGS